MDKAVAFVPVRLTSTRLPRKHFKMIGDKTVLSWVIYRLKKSTEIDEIIICAPEEDESRELIQFCKNENVRLFVYDGEINDVVGRLATAANIYEADICVLASGDCPLLASETIDKLVKTLKLDRSADGIFISTQNNQPVIHEGLIVSRNAIWQKAESLSKTSELREHQFPLLFIKPELFTDFRFLQIVDNPIFYTLKHRISVDTQSDLAFLNTLYNELKIKGLEFTLFNAIEYLALNPSLIEINASVKRKNIYDKSEKIAIFVSAVEQYGYGNLMRSLELAKSLIDNHGFGVSFFVLDEKAQDYIQRFNFQADVIEDSQFNFPVDNFSCVLFDVNKNFQFDKTFIHSIKSKGILTAVIDNTNHWAKATDIVFIPTAHYSNQSFYNLRYGPDYIVVREEIRKHANESAKKENLVLIYCNTPNLESKIQRKINELQIASPNLQVDWIKSPESSFHKKLASSKYIITPLGQSAYEAVFLGVEPIIIPTENDEVDDISAFHQNLAKLRDSNFGFGADKIALELSVLLNERGTTIVR